MEQLYFYDQTVFRKKPKRYRKDPDELPTSLRYANVNPKVAAYLASKEKAKAEGGLDPVESGNITPEELTPKRTTSERSQSIADEKSPRNGNEFIYEEEIDFTQQDLYHESKRGASELLNQINSVLEIVDTVNIPVPRRLEYKLLQSFKELCEGTDYTPRAWQTKEGKEDYEKEKSKKKHKNDDREFKLDKSNDNSYDSDDSKSVNLDKESKRGRRTGKVGKHHLGDISEDDELGKNPVIKVERAPSMASVRLGVSKMRRGTDGLSVSSREQSSQGYRFKFKRGSAGERRTPRRSHGSRYDDSSTIIESTSGDSSRSAFHEKGYYMPTIQFALSSRACEEKGWIHHDEDKVVEERDTVLEWARVRLQAVMRAARLQQQKDIETGFDKPLELRYYGDASTKDRRRGPQPPQAQRAVDLVNGIFPKIPNLTSQEDIDGKRLMFAANIDGSTSLYYNSGRVAILSSSAGVDKPGFYTNIYDDSPEMNMLASFTPSGKGVCYRSNGSVWFSAYETGGLLFNEDGAVQRKWKWPTNANAKLPMTIHLMLNQYVTFRCLNQGSMQILYSCDKREVLKFPVSPVPGAIEPVDEKDLGQLKSGLTFTSATAKEFAKPLKAREKQKIKFKSHLQKKKKKKQKAASATLR